MPFVLFIQKKNSQKKGGIQQQQVQQFKKRTTKKSQPATKQLQQQQQQQQQRSVEREIGDMACFFREGNCSVMVKLIKAKHLQAIYVKSDEFAY